MKMISETFIELVAKINKEVRQPTRFQSANGQVIVTSSFIIKISTYQIFICRQTEARLTTTSVNHVTVANERANNRKLTTEQNLTIDVTAGDTKFQIFIKGSEFEEFAHVLSAPLQNVDNFEYTDLWTQFANESLKVSSLILRNYSHFFIEMSRLSNKMKKSKGGRSIFGMISVLAVRSISVKVKFEILIFF